MELPSIQKQIVTPEIAEYIMSKEIGADDMKEHKGKQSTDEYVCMNMQPFSTVILFYITSILTCKSTGIKSQCPLVHPVEAVQ